MKPNNTTTLIGRITTDIEIRKTQSNKSVFKTSLAVDRGTKDEKGNKQTDFIEVSFWGNNADFLQNYANKGTLVAVVGRLEQNHWISQDGKKMSKLSVSAENVQILQKAQEQSKAVNSFKRNEMNVDDEFDEEEPW